MYRKLTKSIKNISCGVMALPIGVLMLTTGGTAVSAPASMPPDFPSLSMPMAKSNGEQAVQALKLQSLKHKVTASYYCLSVLKPFHFSYQSYNMCSTVRSTSKT